MRILVAHNFYQQPGGEDEVFHSERALLESFGHSVRTFEMHNDDVSGMNRLALLGATIWNRQAASRLSAAVCEHRAEVVHFHNTFPLMSPGAYYAARNAGAAVVQTLHNFRILCPGANFYRDGKVCENCLGKSIPISGVVHKCYRRSRIATGGTAAMLSFHRMIGTWANAVDAYITPTNFAREKFVAGGLPAKKIFVKPNFLHPAPNIASGGGGYAAFVGRLSEEKGIDTLLAGWDVLGAEVPLKIVGDGPLAESVKVAVAKNPAIQWLGRRPADQVYQLIGGAELLVVPSNCYETFGRVAIEAYATGTPVIASNHGAPAEVVDDGRTGLRFKPGDGADLAAKVRMALADRTKLAEMRREARREFEAKYAGPINHEMLIGIYEKARAGRPSHAVKPQPAAAVA
jgi:glycosyltransferase involved in cell wall biosynthesis